MKIKSILPISLIVFPWLILLPFLCQIAQLEQLSQWLFANTVKPVYTVFPFILALNVLCDYAFVWETKELAKWSLWVKLLLIPVYLVIGWLNAQSKLTVLILFAALLHLTSAGYGVRVLIRKKKEKKLKLLPCLILALFHFIIVVDVITALFLYRKLKS